ncbi:hypothetical protein G6F62_014124 [Rhizopus arrhizus]|nr:hypothetical protein G6F40_016397 [Rhizopus arrhizus]KAG1313244.1 hypothetical protein G6F62_014124 [Rhizopus arrhizus]
MAGPVWLISMYAACARSMSTSEGSGRRSPTWPSRACQSAEACAASVSNAASASCGSEDRSSGGASGSAPLASAAAVPNGKAATMASLAPGASETR